MCGCASAFLRVKSAHRRRQVLSRIPVLERAGIRRYGQVVPLEVPDSMRRSLAFSAQPARRSPRPSRAPPPPELIGSRIDAVPPGPHRSTRRIAISERNQASSGCRKVRHNAMPRAAGRVADHRGVSSFTILLPEIIVPFEKEYGRGARSLHLRALRPGSARDSPPEYETAFPRRNSPASRATIRL